MRSSTSCQGAVQSRHGPRDRRASARIPVNCGPSDRCMNDGHPRGADPRYGPAAPGCGQSSDLMGAYRARMVTRHSCQRRHPAGAPPHPCPDVSPEQRPQTGSPSPPEASAGTGRGGTSSAPDGPLPRLGEARTRDTAISRSRPPRTAPCDRQLRPPRAASRPPTRSAGRRRSAGRSISPRTCTAPHPHGVPCPGREQSPGHRFRPGGSLTRPSATLTATAAMPMTCDPPAPGRPCASAGRRAQAAPR